MGKTEWTKQGGQNRVAKTGWPKQGDRAGCPESSKQGVPFPQSLFILFQDTEQGTTSDTALQLKLNGYFETDRSHYSGSSSLKSNPSNLI